MYALLYCSGTTDGEYIWPLSNSTEPDQMNTSFGPRIDGNKWDFHDGIDLPAPIGTKVYAMRGGKVRHAGPRGSGGFRSRHVVLEVDDPTDGLIYLVYLHLDTIAEGITSGTSVTQGQQLGTVGDDDASYPHLHFEFRKGTYREIGSAHPLGYLPYDDTPNFHFQTTASGRFNRLGALMTARLLFAAENKLEGDLRRIEVDLLAGGTLLQTRIADFNDKKTINEGNSDELVYVSDIGVEGYQKSNMVADKRTDLKYGILIRDIPAECDVLVARVMDVSGNVAASPPFTVRKQERTDERADFENGAMPPVGWIVVTSATGSGATVANDTAAAHSGARGMLCIDASAAGSNTQRAGIERALPPGRFEWVAEGWFNPTALGLAEGQFIYLLYFHRGGKLSVAARIRNESGVLRPGIVAKQPGSRFEAADANLAIEPNVWRKWRLHLLRIGTRETTAILYLNEGWRLREQARLNWDSTDREPLAMRAGIGLSSTGATATVMADDLRVTESLLVTNEYDAQVLKLLLPQQAELRNARERCSADPVMLESIGRAVGQQIRVLRKDNPQFVALYTVKQPNPEADLSDPGRANVVRTGQSGRERLGVADVMEVTVRATVVDPAPGPGEPLGVRFFEMTEDDGKHADLIAIAPHGGKIEEHTDKQASELVHHLLNAKLRASFWLCQGYGDAAMGAFDRWHITSTDLAPACFPRLQPIVSRRFSYGLAFHGFERKADEADVYIGGNASQSLKAALEKALKDLGLPLKIKISTADDDSKFQGFSSDNLINRLAADGLHLEQSAEARVFHHEIAKAAAQVFASCTL